MKEKCTVFKVYTTIYKKDLDREMWGKVWHFMNGLQSQLAEFTKGNFNYRSAGVGFEQLEHEDEDKLEDALEEVFALKKQLTEARKMVGMALNGKHNKDMVSWNGLRMSKYLKDNPEKHETEATCKN